MDNLLCAFSPSKQIEIAYADVTEAAKLLEQKHLSGPTAGRCLGKALAAAALLSAELGDDDERLSVQAQVNGPLGGFLVDASKIGNLRGYTTIKILNEYDHTDSADLKDVVGDVGALTIIRSNGRKIISQSQIECSPLNLCHALARYYNNNKNKPTAIEIIASSQNHYLHRAVGICVSRLPEGKSEDFVPVLERFNDKTIQKALMQNVDIDVLNKLLGVDDFKIVVHRELTAKCTCSREKVLYSISCLPIEELEEIIEKKECPEVTCHFCSTAYRIDTTEVARLMRERQQNRQETK